MHLSWLFVITVVSSSEQNIAVILILQNVDGAAIYFGCLLNNLPLFRMKKWQVGYVITFNYSRIGAGINY